MFDTLQGCNYPLTHDLIHLRSYFFLFSSSDSELTSFCTGAKKLISTIIPAACPPNLLLSTLCQIIKSDCPDPVWHQPADKHFTLYFFSNIWAYDLFTLKHRLCCSSFILSGPHPQLPLTLWTTRCSLLTWGSQGTFEEQQQGAWEPHELWNMSPAVNCGRQNL